MKLKFSIEKQTLIRKDKEILTSYSKNKNKCVFYCHKKWADIYKYALFIDVKNKQYIVDLGFGSKVYCTIPNDVLKGNYFSVSVFGDDRYTTTQETILIQPSGFSDKTESAIESGELEVDGDSSSDSDDLKMWRHPRRRCNIFEIEEHPYY